MTADEFVTLCVTCAERRLTDTEGVSADYAAGFIAGVEAFAASYAAYNSMPGAKRKAWTARPLPTDAGRTH